MRLYMLQIFTSAGILIEGAAGAFLIWFVHHLSLWFLFDSAALQANMIELLHFIEALAKIGSTVLITYWTYKGIAKTVKKNKE